MLEQDIQEIEINIEAARAAVKKADALSRLYNNQDFKEIIIEGYFKGEASRLVLLKGDVNIDEEAERHCEKMINGIGCLRAYFQMVNHFAHQAKIALEEDEGTREELLREQLEAGSE